MGAGGEEVQVRVFGDWTDVGDLGGGWTRESGGGRVRGGCLPQGVGAPPAMLRGRTAGFPKKLGGRASGEAG